MKKFIFILIIVFAFIGYSEIKNFNNNSSNSIEVSDGTVQACHIDMQSNKDLICD